MKKFFKNINGLTLTEVLVTIGIVMTLSVYGVTFFEAAYKYRSENDDYLTVLNNVASNLESSKYAMAVDRLFTTETLGGDKTATYNVVFGADVNGGSPITSSATVIATNSGSPVTTYTVTLASYVYQDWIEKAE